MTNYMNDIYDMLTGDTPKQKYDNLKSIMELLDSIAYPRRGTDAENWTIQDVANKIIDNNMTAPISNS